MDQVAIPGGEVVMDQKEMSDDMQKELDEFSKLFGGPISQEEQDFIKSTIQKENEIRKKATNKLDEP